jgi:hypothetical protein
MSSKFEIKDYHTGLYNTTDTKAKKNNTIKDEENFKSFVFLQNESLKLKQYIKGIVKKNTLNEDHNSNSNKSDNIVVNKIKNDSIISMKQKFDASNHSLMEDIANRSIDAILKQDISNFRYIKKVDVISDSEVSEDLMINELSEDYVLNTNSIFYNLWETLLSITLFYIFVFDTYIFAFIENEEDILARISIIIDMIYMLDFIKSFFIPFYDFEENLIKNRKLIFYNYLQNGFFVDLITGIPFSIIINVYNNESTQHLKFIRIAKISRITRLTRVFKLTKMAKGFKKDNTAFKLKIIEDLNISSNVKRFARFGLYFILFTHISSCLWVYVSKLEQPNWITWNNYQNDDNFSIYVSALYFNLVTVFSIGYGDISSVNMYERIFNIILMIFGVLLYSFTITSLSNIVVKIDKKEKQYNKRVDFLDEVRLKYRLDPKLYRTLYRFLTYDLQTNKINKKMILNELPQRLQYNLIMQIYKKPIDTLKLFDNTPSDFKFKTVTMLKQLKMIKGEYLIKKGDFLEEIYFIKKGITVVEYNIGLKRFTLLKLYAKEHFGDVYMCRNIRSPLGLYVKSKYVELYLLEKKDFISLNEEFPEIIEKIIKISLTNTTKIELRAKDIFTRYTKDYCDFAINPKFSSNMLFTTISNKSRISKKKFSSKISNYTNNTNEEFEDDSHSNLQLLNFSKKLDVVEEDISDSGTNSDYMSSKSSWSEQAPLQTAPNIKISYNINIQNNLNFTKKSDLIKNENINNDDRLITNNFMNQEYKNFQDSLMHNISPSNVFQNLTDMTIEAVKDIDFHDILNLKKRQLKEESKIKDETKSRTSILKPSELSTEKRKESKIIFDVDEKNDPRTPKTKRRVSGTVIDKNDFSQEIEKVSRSSLFNNLFTDKSKRRLTRIISPIDLNEKRSNSVVNVDKKKNSLFKREEDAKKRKSSFSPLKKVRKISESHFSEIMKNLKKDAFVLNNPLGIFSKEEGPSRSFIIQEHIERITEMFEEFMVNVFRYNFKKS